MPTPTAPSLHSEGLPSRLRSQTRRGGGGGAGRCGPFPEQLVQGLHPAAPSSSSSSSDRCPSRGVGGEGFAPHSVPFLRSLPPRTPASPPPTSLRQGPLPVASVPTAPSAPRSSGDPPRLSGPRAARSGSPPLAHRQELRLFGKPRTCRPPVTAPRPRAEPLDCPGEPPGLPGRGPAPTYPPNANSAGRNPAVLPPRRAAPGHDATPGPWALRLRSAKLEFPGRRHLRTSGPPRSHSPAAGPAQLRRLRLYLGRQEPPSATTSPMTTGPPQTTLPTSPLGGGAAALCYDWLTLPARQRVFTAPFPGRGPRPRPDRDRPRSSFSCNWWMSGQFEVVIGYCQCLLP